MTDPPNEFALQLQTLRHERSLSIRALAKLTGVSAVTIWKWEHGDCNPRRRHMLALENAFGMPLGSLGGAGGNEVAGELSSPGTHAVSNPALSAQPDTLANVITRAKEMIAKAAGNSPDHVVIRLDF
jgi:transcriptional regulator with XRE-family HTH domain